MAAFTGDLNDILSKYINLVPISLRYSDSYLVYFALLCRDNEIDLDNINDIDSLIDINRTSYKFVDGLWQYLNSHKDDKKKALDFYNTILDRLIAYGEEREYLSMYSYLVPESLEDSNEYKAYLVHLVEFYRSDVDSATVPEDLENREIVSYGTLENIWSYYNYNFRQGSQEDKEALSVVVKAIRDIWTEKRYEYLYLIPEYLRTNEGFLVFVSLMVHEFEITQRNIGNFTNLVDSDKVPIKFLENLGAYINYKYLERGDEDFNREALLSMRHIWEMRGSDHAIIMAATHGYNPAYVGGDMFIPNYPITDDLAEIIVGISRVFIHSKSNFSSIYVYPDNISYMPGVIIIVLPFVNDNIRRKVIEVMPAGVRYVFWLMVAGAPQDVGLNGTLTYRIKVVSLPQKGELPDDEENSANLFMTLEPTFYYDAVEDDMFTHSESRFPLFDPIVGKYVYTQMLSGRRMQNVLDSENSYDMIACVLILDLLKRPFLSIPGGDDDSKYFISPSGEYLDIRKIFDDPFPGVQAVKRKFDYNPYNNLYITIDCNIDEDIEVLIRGYEFLPSYELAVSALPIELQEQFFARTIVRSRRMKLKDGDTTVADGLNVPFDLRDKRIGDENDYLVGTISKDFVFLYGDIPDDESLYVVSPTGELIDTVLKEVDSVVRTLILDYTPELELTLIPA